MFVKGVPSAVTVDQLKEVFEKAGPIASIRQKAPHKYEDGSQPLFMNYFVLFEDVGSAQKSIQLYDQTNPFSIGVREIRVDFWRPIQDRKQEQKEKEKQDLTSMFMEIM